MTFKVQVGPPQIAIHQAMTVLISETDGQIEWPTDKGLYFFDTRLISAWAVYANGTEWDLLNGGAINFDAARIFMTNQAFLTEDGSIPARPWPSNCHASSTRACTRTWISQTMGRSRVRFNLEITLRSDFADIFDVKAKALDPPRPHHLRWSEARQTLRTNYQNADFGRSVAVSVGEATRGRCSRTDD